MRAVGRGDKNRVAEKFIFIGDRSAEKTWIFLFFFFLYWFISAHGFINCHDVNLGQLGHPLLERAQGGADYFS